MNGSKLFSKLDIKQAFHQLKIHEESRNLTTITTHVGLYRYKRLHMGISSASEIFSETIRRILENCPGQLNMTDDILVYGRSEQKHHENLMRVLETLERCGLTLNAEKCEFFRKKIIFFSLSLSEDGIAPTHDRCQALKDIQAPRNVKELRSLLGLIQYSGRFLKDVHSIAEPLRRLTRKDTTWQWTQVEQAALEQLKSTISTQYMAYFKVVENRARRRRQSSRSKRSARAGKSSKF